MGFCLFMSSPAAFLRQCVPRTVCVRYGCSDLEGLVKLACENIWAGAVLVCALLTMNLFPRVVVRLVVVTTSV